MHNVLRLPRTRKEYYVQCTKCQFLKLIKETSQLDIDRCLTSSITQFIGYFKYRMSTLHPYHCLNILIWNSISPPPPPRINSILQENVYQFTYFSFNNLRFIKDIDITLISRFN